MRDFHVTAAWLLVAFSLAVTSTSADEKTATGPATENRFPALKVPDEFRATLFACDPLIEYPSVISLGPKFGSLYVAYDYMTGLGVKIVRRDEVRLVYDSDGDGYADKSELYADGFNSIQGLAYQDGVVYVMHAPFLTSLRDTDGDGKADERNELLKGLGLQPEKNNSRLHCANGVVVGHDGWLYLALGDNSCDIQRPEGDRLLFQEGGILRCRPDGTDLHVFSGGLRNIYDIALDEELNVFVRDNENDGGDYMIRVCHSFHGADHGYPYLYYERPGEAMPPLADLGRGSSAGGVCYLETLFPGKYRGNLFFCEWGRSIVRYDRKRSGSSFAKMAEFEFASGAETDPYGFKPTDAIVDYDGSLVISDWCDGQRPKRGRGRIYRITPVDAPKPNSINQAASAGIEQLVQQLNSDSYHARVNAQLAIQKVGNRGLKSVRAALKQKQLTRFGKLHAIWILARLAKESAVEELFEIAKSDGDPSVRAQAVRALADLTDPILTKDRLTAGRGGSKIAQQLATLTNSGHPQIQLEVAIALRRLKWPQAVDWVAELKTHDAALSHAAMQLMRGIDNWSGVLKLLDGPIESSTSTIVSRALARQAHEQVADALIERVRSSPNSARSGEFADLLTRIYKKPSPWTYWGYRPAPRTANPIEWKRTATIEAALDHVLVNSNNTIRKGLMRRMQREQVPVRLTTIAKWLNDETDSESLAAILVSLKTFPPSDVRQLLEQIVLARKSPTESRIAALQLLIDGLEKSTEIRLLDLSRKLEHSAVLAHAIRDLGHRSKVSSTEFLKQQIGSKSGDVRAASIESLARLKIEGMNDRIVTALNDKDVNVRRASVFAVGELKIKTARDLVLVTANDPAPEIRAASLSSLLKLEDARAVSAAVAALEVERCQLAALNYLQRFGGAKQAEALVAVAKKSRRNDILIKVSHVLAQWSQRDSNSESEQFALQRALATVHGTTSVVMNWQVSKSIEDEAVVTQVNSILSRADGRDPIDWSNVIAPNADGIVTLPDLQNKPTKSARLMVAEIFVEQPAKATMMASSVGPLRAWLNEPNEKFHRSQTQRFRVDSDRFDVQLRSGLNRIVIQLAASTKNERLHLRFHRNSSSVKKEQLATAALQRRGNAGKGRDIFMNKEKSQCMKCHRIGDQGARIGPDLSGIGKRFSRIHLIESVLEPSRSVAPSYETRSVVLGSGLVVTGVKISETATVLKIGDIQGKVYDIDKSEIVESRTQKTSTMPNDLEKNLSEQDFVHLIEYLLSLRANSRN